MLPELVQSHPAICSSISVPATLLQYETLKMEFGTSGMLNEGTSHPELNHAVEVEASFYGQQLT